MPLDLLNQNGVGWLKMFLRFEEVRRPQTKERAKIEQTKMLTFYPYLSCDHNTQGILVTFYAKSTVFLH